MEYKSSTELIKSIKEGNIKPIYLLHGEESFFIDEITQYIENNVLNDNERAFNQDILYGRDVDIRQIIDIARQIPMMGQLRIVVVREAQMLKDIKSMEGYISSPSSHTVLVLAHKNKKIDGRISWIKTAKKSDQVGIFVSSVVRDYKLGAWLSDYLRQRGRQITPDANQLLCDYLGTDLKKLTNEVIKIELNIATDEKITAKTVEKYVGISKDYNAFELSKALSNRDISRAHRISANLGENHHKTPLQMIIPTLFSHFQKAHLIKRTGNRSNQELSSLLRINPYVLREYMTTSQNYSESGFFQIFELLAEADSRSKGVGSRRNEPEQILKELVARILTIK